MISNTNSYIEIRPKSKLSYCFWSDPYRLPKDAETLSYFGKKRVQFVIALGKHTMKNKFYNRIQKLLDNNIGINICLLDKDFAHLDNSHNFIRLYKLFRKSSVSESANEIYLDAEISNKYRKTIRNSTWNKKIAYIFNNYPSKKEYQNAIDNYNRLGKLIHTDGKKFGIIRSITAAYEVDKLTRNVPFKEINEDITVVMVYRLPERRKREYKDYWFYQMAKKEGNNIFLGGTNNGYRNLRKDITICSYLKKERIYIYDYYGFQKFCKYRDLKPYKFYKLKKDPLESLKHFSKFTGIEIANKIIKLFKLK
jgi:hypothetical protein